MNTPYIAKYLMTSLPKIPLIHHIYIYMNIWIWPTLDIRDTHTMEPFQELDLDSQRAKKLASKLCVHAVEYAAKLIHVHAQTHQCACSQICCQTYPYQTCPFQCNNNSHQEPVSGQACNSPDYYWPFPLHFCFSSCLWWRKITMLGRHKVGSLCLLRW